MLEAIIKPIYSIGAIVLAVLAAVALVTCSILISGGFIYGIYYLCGLSELFGLISFPQAIGLALILGEGRGMAKLAEAFHGFYAKRRAAAIVDKKIAAARAAAGDYLAAIEAERSYIDPRD